MLLEVSLLLPSFFVDKKKLDRVGRKLEKFCFRDVMELYRLFRVDKDNFLTKVGVKKSKFNDVIRNYFIQKSSLNFFDHGINNKLCLIK